MHLSNYFRAVGLWLSLLIFFVPFQQLYAQCSPTALEIPLNGIDEDCDGLDDIYLHLPPHIYTVVGQEFEFYFRNVILSTHPNDYRFTVSSTLGGTTNLDKWVFTPTAGQVGEHSFSVAVTTPSGTVLKTANCTMRISQAGTPPNMAPKKILLWGHSFIDQGYMPYYLDSLLGNGTNPVVSFHGKRSNWVDNNKTRFEAVGGSSWLLYYNTPGSPFFYNGQLNMRAYFDEVCGVGQSPDWIVIHLDVNDYLFTGSLDGTTMQSIDDYITLIYTTRTQPMMAALRAAAPNTKIAVSYTPMPNARQSAFTNTFGASSILSNKYRWQKIVSRLLFRNTQFFGGRENENIYLLPIHLDMDDLNDYGTSDPVHPVVDVANLRARSGYREIAKSTYAWLKYIQNPSGTAPTCVINSASPSQIACNNNGTPEEPTDDTFTFNLAVAATNGTGSWKTTINAQEITGSYNTAKSMGPFPISAGVLNFTVTDNSLSTCTFDVTITPPATCSNGQPPAPTCVGNLLVNGDFENGRNNWNGTGTITTDAASGTGAISVCGTSYDNLRQTFTGQPNSAYTLSLTAKREANATRNPYAHVKFLTSGFSVIDVKTLEITQTDYQTYSLNVTSPSNTGWIEIALVVDNGTGCLTADDLCFAPTTTTPPACTLAAQVTAITCNNNNTPNTTTDDTFTFSLTVNGTNAGTSGWRTTFNGQTITGTYGTARSMGPAPISIGTSTLTITDQTTATCSTTVQIVPPAPCSTPLPCALAAQVTAITCNNNNTPNTITDDTFTFSLTVNGTNTGTSGWRTTFNGQTITGAYGTARSMGPAPISIGTSTLTITDQTTATCSTTVQVVPPAPCSTPLTCALSAQVTAITCNNNNTPNTTTDDTFTFSLTVNGTNAGASGWRTTFNGQTVTGTYGTARSMGSAPITIGTSTLTITDQTTATCSTTVQVVPPAPCSTPLPCALAAQVTAITCNNNNTPNTTTDDTFTFSLTVNGTNAGNSGWRTTFNGQTITGAYGTARSMGPAPISIGTSTLTITDQTTATCSTTVQVVPPAPCSTPLPTGTCTNNLLANPGFENNLTAWDGSAATIVTTAANGTKAARLCGTTFTTLRQTLAAQPDSSYTLQVQARKETPTATRNPVLQLKFMSAAWSPLAVKTQEITSANYGVSSVTLTAPAGAAWVESLVYVDGNSGCILVDDFCLTTGTVAPGPQPVSYCAVSSNNPWEDWISSVRLNGTTKTSGKSVYSDHTATQFNLNRTGNNTIDLTAMFSFFTYNENWKVWIDYNQNGIFEEPSEVAVQAIATRPANGLNATKVQNAVFVVPAGALSGSTRMRVAMSRGVYTSPCQNPAFGEVEDFTVNISNTLQSSQSDLIASPSEAPAAYTLYPNPATQELWITLGEQAPGTTVQVSMFSPSANTRLQHSFSAHVSDAIRLDLHTLQTGLYFVQIQVGNQRPVVEKVVVVRE